MKRAILHYPDGRKREVRISEESGDLIRTGFGTFQKPEMTWILDPRFRLVRIEPEQRSSV